MPFVSILRSQKALSWHEYMIIMALFISVGCLAHWQVQQAALSCPRRLQVEIASPNSAGFAWKSLQACPQAFVRQACKHSMPKAMKASQAKVKLILKGYVS
jgi:hypothetical protein